MVTASGTQPDPRLRWGLLLMSIAGLGFIGYGLIFFHPQLHRELPRAWDRRGTGGEKQR
jgi:hypothetical protein